jgi:hypothetical protein
VRLPDPSANNCTVNNITTTLGIILNTIKIQAQSSFLDFIRFYLRDWGINNIPRKNLELLARRRRAHNSNKSNWHFISILLPKRKSLESKNSSKTLMKLITTLDSMTESL